MTAREYLKTIKAELEIAQEIRVGNRLGNIDGFSRLLAYGFQMMATLVEAGALVTIFPFPFIEYGKVDDVFNNSLL